MLVLSTPVFRYITSSTDGVPGTIRGVYMKVNFSTKFNYARTLVVFRVALLLICGVLVSSRIYPFGF